MQKMPGHVTNQLSSSYFLRICLPCTFLNMHFFLLFFAQCQPFLVKFCLLLPASPQVQESVQDYGGCPLGLEQKLRMMDS